MMHNLLARWRSVPYRLSVFIWLFAILLIGDWLGAPYFQSDFRLRFSFICIAAFVVSSMHDLIYKRKRLNDLLVTLGIVVVAIALGIWMSFAFFDADSALNFLPILALAIVAWGVDAWVRRKSRKA